MNPTEPVMSTYFHSRGKKLGLPVSGTFELTGRCNFNCKMCYVHSKKAVADDELSAEQWIDIAENAKKNGMLFLLLTGGEPLLREDFSELYRALSEMGFVISINTNGSLIDDKILELFKNHPPCRVNISLYGGSEDTYKALCENRQYSKVTDNIKKLKEMGVSVSLNSVFNKINGKDLDKIYDEAERLGVNVRGTSYLYPGVRVGEDYGENKIRFSPEDAAKYNIALNIRSVGIEKIDEKAEKFFNLKNSDCGEAAEGEGVRCRAGSSSFWITYDGRMQPCGMMFEPSVRLSDIGFEKAWQVIREKTAEIRLPAQCVSCKYRKVCSVCAAMCYSETGSFSSKPEYLCRMVESIVAEYNGRFVKKEDSLQ